MQKCSVSTQIKKLHVTVKMTLRAALKNYPIKLGIIKWVWQRSARGPEMAPPSFYC